MADAELKVRIDAELGGLKSGLKQAEQAVNSGGTSINNSVNKIQGSFTILNNTKFTFGQNFTSASNQLANQAAKTGQALGTNLKRGSDQAAFALTNLGRVTQDAPFGFIGIQNNLNPLLESFQRLKAETGTTGGALKALGQSLIGPAGLGLALSVVSAGILLYQQYQQKAKKATEEAKGANEEYTDSLNQVDQARIKGAQSAVKEGAELKALFAIYQNSNLPLAKRKEAYEEIQRLYPSYFGNLKFENEATDKTKNAYDRLSSSIIATARARAGIDIITKNAQTQLEIEQQLTDNQAEINKILAENAIIRKRAEGSQGALGAGVGASNTEGFYRAIARNEERINDLNLIKNDLTNKNNDLKNKNLQIEKLITGEVEKGAKITGSVGGDAVKSTGKDVKTVSDILKTLDIELQKVSNAVDITFGEGNKQKIKAFASATDSLTEIGASDGVITGIQNQLLNVQGVIPAAKTLGVTTASAFGTGFAAASTQISGVTFKPQYDLLSQELIDFNANISDIINGGIVTSFAAIGESLGAALSGASGVAQSFGATLLSTLGSLLGQLGQMAVATGVALLGIQTALKTLNPYAAIGAGIALLALAGVVKGKAAKLGGGIGGGGGGSSSPTPSYSTSGGGSYSSGFTSGSEGRVVFEISGTNLIGVLNRAGAKLQRATG